MGSGKTRWATEFMFNHPEERFLFVTPLLDDVKEIGKKCPFLIEPDASPTKHDAFRRLLARGQNIITTQLISIYEPPAKSQRMIHYPGRDLSHNWFRKRAKKAEKTQLKNYIYDNQLIKLQEELEAFGEGAVVDNPSRMIVHDDKRIFVLNKPSGQFEHSKYEPELYYTLCCPSVCTFSWDYQDQRMQVEIHIRQKNGKRWTRNWSRFLDLWYHKDCSVEEFLNNLPVGDETIPFRKQLTTDHVNEDKRNNCSWNLLEMTRSENSRKEKRVSRIKLPYFFYTAVDSKGKIRVHFGFMNSWHEGQGFFILCEDVNSLIELCEAIMKIDRAPESLKRDQTPYELWKADAKAAYAAENIEMAEREAALMLKMKEPEFHLWTNDGRFIVRRAGEGCLAS